MNKFQRFPESGESLFRMRHGCIHCFLSIPIHAEFLFFLHGKKLNLRCKTGFNCVWGRVTVPEIYEMAGCEAAATAAETL